MFFDQGTPDTSVYMIAGYVLFFVITAIYLASLFLRTRNLRRDLDTLEAMETEEEPASEVKSAPTPRKAKTSPPKRKVAKSSRKKAAQKR